MRLVKTQKILNFSRIKPNSINKELIYIKSKLIKTEHLACKKKSRHKLHLV